MPRIKTTIIAFAIAATILASAPSESYADGPLRRWLRGLWRPNTVANCNTCNQAGCYQPTATTANYTPNAYNLQPGQCMKTCQQTCSRTVVNYVPYTAYRTVTNRVPVTQYKPVTNSDPCTGCTVTCMKPCTTYTYQVQRVPYTTYRPCYRQETYKVPVTTITNDCSTGTCGTACNTCGVNGLQTPVLAPQGNYAPTPAAAPGPQTSTYYEVPGTISTGGTYGSTTGGVTPADTAPVLQNNPTTLQRPVLERMNSNYQASAPARINIQETAALSPIHKKFNYSPVRLASYSEPVQRRAPVQATQPVRFAQPVQATPAMSQPIKRNGWVEVN